MFSIAFDVLIKILKVYRHQNPTMSMVDLVANDIETLRIDSECSLEKEFTEWIHINP